MPPVTGSPLCGTVLAIYITLHARAEMLIYCLAGRSWQYPQRERPSPISTTCQVTPANQASAPSGRTDCPSIIIQRGYKLAQTNLHLQAEPGIVQSHPSRVLHVSLSNLIRSPYLSSLVVNASFQRWIQLLKRTQTFVSAVFLTMALGRT